MPQVCEGCTSETKVKLLVKRDTFFAKSAVGAPTGERTDGGAERREAELQWPIAGTVPNDLGSL